MAKLTNYCTKTKQCNQVANPKSTNDKFADTKVLQNQNLGVHCKP